MTLAQRSIRLRPFTAKDEPALALLFTDPAVRQWNPVNATAAGWWPSANDVDPRSRTWAIADAQDDRMLGTMSAFDIEGDEAEIGYRVLATESGRGIATAAVREAVRVIQAETLVVRIRLVHAVANVASCRVALKCGFRLVRTVPGTEAYGDDRLYDEHVHRYHNREE